MFTPQQIEQVSFGRATFGGYDMQSVDAFLEPLTEDYITLYKENALLKSKMKVLVSKLEEYRNNEASMKDAIVNAQKTCDLMVKEAEAKCTQMLADANATAIENAKNADSIIVAENARVEEARRVACEKIDLLTDQILACAKMLAHIKESNLPAEVPAEEPVAEEASATPPRTEADAVADEISANLQALVGGIDDPAPAAEPKPATDMNSKFANLQFGRNYDPNKH